MPTQLSPHSEIFSFSLRTAQFGQLKNRCFFTSAVYCGYFWSPNLDKLQGFCWFSGEKTKQHSVKPHLSYGPRHGGERVSVFITDGHIGSYGRTWQWKIRSIVVSQFLRARNSGATQSGSCGSRSLMRLQGTTCLGLGL